MNLLNTKGRVSLISQDISWKETTSYDINEYQSKKPIYGRVPQGSVLDPFPFFLFINNLTDNAIW